MPVRSLAHALAFSSWVVVFLAVLPMTARGQSLEDAELVPPPPKKKDGVQITFLPPPMQGLISMGVYDSTGRLVRVLHREATEKQFAIGLNGFITRWDGKGSQGEMLPPGKYAAKGWMVGDQAVEGVAFRGNDWIQGDGPRFTQLVKLAPAENGAMQVVLRDAAGAEHTVAVDAVVPTNGLAKPGVSATVEDGRLTLAQGEMKTEVILAEGEKVVRAVVGRGDQTWAIVEAAGRRELRAYAADGEFLRRLAYREEEPAPFDVAPGVDGDSLYLLERNDREQRLRVLAQPESAGDVSAWKTVLQKRIVASDTFAAVAAELGRAQPPQADAVVKLTSKPNPLLQNARAEVQVQAAVEADGVWLVTGDGLPLAQLTEGKGLKWAVLVREGKALTLFQGDGVVVEEFRIGNAENLMSFDAGEYALKK